MLLVCGADRPLLDRIHAGFDGEPIEVVEELASLVQAAGAPSVSRVIVVTTRVDTDGELRRLRRSGARYVIVRPPRIVDVEALRGKRVLVPRPQADEPFVTIDDLARAVLTALRDPHMMGVTIDVPPSGLAALEAVGARPQVVAPWRARVGRWLKQPVLEAVAG